MTFCPLVDFLHFGNLATLSPWESRDGGKNPNSQLMRLFLEERCKNSKTVFMRLEVGRKQRLNASMLPASEKGAIKKAMPH